MFSELEYKNNVLHFCDVDLSKISDKYKTPIYIYSKNKIEKNYLKYKNAFEKNNINNYQISYAIKSNDNLSILKILKNLGSGVDTVSVGEIQKAILAGFDTSKIVFSGVGKTEEDLTFAIKNRIGQINIESYEEFLTICEIAKKLNIVANISVRVNPNIDAHTHDKITTGKKENKFGVDISVAKKIIEKATKDNDVKGFLNFNGLSAHIGSQILDISCFEELFKFFKDVYKEYKDVFKTIDFGGGVGIQYKEEDKTIDLNDYAKLINKYFGYFNGKIIVEPGRSIIGDTCIFLSKIVRIKKTELNNFVIIDGGMNNLIRPAMYEAFHYPMVVKKTNEEKLKYNIVGPICESSDVFVNNFEFNKIDENDNYIAFLCAGAYGRSMSSNYNCHDIAGEIMIDNKNIIEIRKPINFKDLIKFEEL